MLIQLLGNKLLAELFIRLPICSVDQPASLLKNFGEALQNVRKSPEASRTRENSKKSETGEARLSKQIYNLRQRLKRAQRVADWVTEDRNNWYQLSRADQNLRLVTEPPTHDFN